MTIGILIVAAVIIVAGGILLTRPARPAYYRRKPIDFLRDMIQTLVPMTEGSVLIIDHERSSLFLQFRKPEDTGRVDQCVVFGFPDAPWSSGYFDSVAKAAETLGLPTEINLRPNPGRESQMRFLEVRLCGSSAEIGEKAKSLGMAVLPALDLPEDARFTFHVEGFRDERIWNRIRAKKGA